MRQKIAKQHQPLPLNFLGSMGVLPIRLMAGLAMVMHGIPKVQHLTTWMDGTGLGTAPPALQAGAAIVQVVGGLCWVLGFMTPAASMSLFVVMWVGVLKRLAAGQQFVTFGGASTGDSQSFELAAFYICVALLLLTTGPGRFSLDAKLFGERHSHKS
jgi:putative oxidoreductase